MKAPLGPVVLLARFVTVMWNRNKTVALAIVVVAAGIGDAQEKYSPPVPATDTIVRNLVATRARQVESLQAFSVNRTYRLDYQGFGGTRHAELQVEAEYVAPDRKQFRVISQSGSKFLLDRILPKFLESEAQDQRESAESEISPRNYDFSLLGTDRINGKPYYVLQIKPRRKGKYLCDGKIWVDAQDFTLSRLEGQPVKNPSFWINHAQLSTEYQNIGDFWLPAHRYSTSNVRFGGKAVLAVDYSDYRVTRVPKAVLEASRSKIVLQRSAGQQ